MNSLLPVIYRNRIFTPKVLSDETGRTKTGIAKTLQRLVKAGAIRKVRRDLYCAVDMGTGYTAANRYEIASSVTPTAHIGYHTALEYLGIAHQPFYTVFVVTGAQTNPFHFEDLEFRPCRETIGDLGVQTLPTDPLVRTTDLERTIVDCCDKTELAGGAEELAHCLEGVYALDENKLRQYLAAYGKAFLYQKTGYMLQRIQKQAGISDNFIFFCWEKGHKNVKKFTNTDESDIYDSHWNLYVPNIISQKEELNEII